MLSDADKIKWFDDAVKFQLDGSIYLILKSRKNGVGSWAIEETVKLEVLNSNMEWEKELPLAKRDAAYLIRTRFDFEAAVAMYEQYKMFAI
jgi:hypothetical protein